jgi:predicted metal-binding membrane protein
MTLPGVLTFFGLALVTMDVLGGILAAGFLARGHRGSHLLAFVGGYALVVTSASLVLHPLLRLVGRLLDPLLASDDVLAVVEIVVGVVVTVDGVVGLASTHHPCLRDLLGLR